MVQTSLQQAGGREFLGDLVHSRFHVLGLPRASADELAAAEQEHDYLWHVEPVHEARELLRLVLDLLEAEADRDGVQVDLGAEVARGDDVLYLALRLARAHT